ncbi:MAG: hypothetical protein M3186_08995 [Actinomycetota bacterium]|nr:hypothetical protein [Actinomycetota bacterium]
MTTPPPPSDSRDQQWPVPGSPSRGPRPRTVEISFWLWIVILTFSGIGILITLTQLDQLRAQVIDTALAQDPTQDRSMIESVMTGALTVGVVFALVFVAAGFAFAFFMRKGRNWARMLLAVPGGLIVLLWLIGLTQGAGPTPALGVSLVQLLLVVAAIATMFGAEANVWFRRPWPGS